MSRIRTVKPEFFRHEGLQDLETSYPTLRPMLVFEGLWTVADKAGRFPWKPKQLKLDILPFIDYDIRETLLVLSDAGYVGYYEVGGEAFGIVENLPTHQRFSGNEAKTPPRWPAPTEILRKEALRKHLGSTREALGKTELEKQKHRGKPEGKGMEYGVRSTEEGKGVVGNSADAGSAPPAPNESPEVSESSESPPSNNLTPIQQLGADWTEITGGVPVWGKLGSHLKPILDKYPFDHIRPAWQEFLKSKHRQRGAAYFAEHFGDFAPRIVSGWTEAQYAEYLSR